MIETPHIVRSAHQHAAVIHITIPREQIQQVMGPAIAEVAAVLASQGAAPIGALFAHHLTLDTKVFDFEVGFPVAAPIMPSGRVVRGELPACDVARTVYHGAYEGLFGAWSEFGAWGKTGIRTPASHIWECYQVGPETSANPADWRTELNQPLLD
jgi:effector-binding domain-containing protein